MALVVGLTQKHRVLQAEMVLGVNGVYLLYISSWNHYNFWLQWPFEMMVD